MYYYCVPCTVIYVISKHIKALNDFEVRKLKVEKSSNSLTAFPKLQHIMYFYNCSYNVDDYYYKVFLHKLETTHDRYE